jgi:tRNA(Arg) A34 adenosine deaminase TadA
VSNADEALIRRTLVLAREARDAGNHPFGSLLAIGRDVVLTAHNTVHTRRDPTAHAETNLVAEAIRRLPPDQIARSVLYTSCEPCAMCAGTIYWAGIRAIVYALPAEELAALAGGSFVVPCRDLLARAKDAVAVAGPFLVAEARAVHEGYWTSPDAQSRAES